MTLLQRVFSSARGGGLGTKLLRGGVGSLALKLANRALTLLVAIALARILQPDGYGVYSFVLAMLTLVAVPVRMGLPMLLMRETASALAHQNYVLVGALWRWSTLLVLAASGIVLSLGWLGLWVGYGWLDKTRLLTFAVGLPVISFLGLNALRGAALKGLHRVVLGQLSEMLVQPLLLLAAIGAVIVLWPGNLTPELAMGAYTLAVVGAFLVGAVLLWWHRPSGIRPSKPSSAVVRNWLAAIIPLAFLSGIQVINKNTDIVMLGLLGVDSEVGVYRVAMQGGLLVIFGVQALNQVFMPYFSSIYASGDNARLQRLVSAGAGATTLVALFVAVVFWVFGPTILTLVFGPEYASAYLPLSILAAGQVFSASMGQVGALLSMTGHERQTLRGFLMAFGVNIALNVALIPYFGALGAATATSTSLVVLNIVLWQSVRVRLGINGSLWAMLIRSPGGAD